MTAHDDRSFGDRSTGKRLRVCHLGKFYPPAPGGIETHVRTLARAQARLGMDVSVLCINHLDRHGLDATWSRYGATSTRREIDEDGVRVTRVGRSMTFARVDFCPMLPRIVRALNKNPPDVFHLHTPNVTMLLTVAVLTTSKVPLVITHHSDIVRQRMRRWALVPYERRVYNRASSIIVSAAEYAAGSEQLAPYQHKIELMPMGLDLQPFLDPDPQVLEEERRLRAEFNNGPLWLAVGRCVYYKGFHTAIEALRHVPGTLLIVGHGPLRVELQRLAERLRVSDRVKFWGYVPVTRLAAAYRAATALWFPSNARSEAFGLVQVEAMASGCPVINTDIPHSGVTWVSPHGQTGLTVPMENPQALAQAARRLMDDSSLRAGFARAARARARDEFCHHTMAERSQAIYSQVLDRCTNPTFRGKLQLMRWVREQTHLVHTH